MTTRAERVLLCWLCGIPEDAKDERLLLAFFVTAAEFGELPPAGIVAQVRRDLGLRNPAPITAEQPKGIA